MSDAREALVETVWISHTQTRRDAEDIADAILAAGWTLSGQGVTFTAASPTAKPSVEDVAAAIETETASYDPVTSPERGEPESLLAADGSDMSLTAARAVLALLPGRTENQVKAEALREWIVEWPTVPGDMTFLADVARSAMDRADRIEREADDE